MNTAITKAEWLYQRDDYKGKRRLTKGLLIGTAEHLRHELSSGEWQVVARVIPHDANHGENNGFVYKVILFRDKPVSFWKWDNSWVTYSASGKRDDWAYYSDARRFYSQFHGSLQDFLAWVDHHGFHLHQELQTILDK